MNADISRVHKSGFKYLQASNISVMRDLVSQKRREQESQATQHVCDAKRAVYKAKWEYLEAGLKEEQFQIDALTIGNQLLRRATSVSGKLVKMKSVAMQCGNG